MKLLWDLALTSWSSTTSQKMTGNKDTIWLQSITIVSLWTVINAPLSLTRLDRGSFTFLSEKNYLNQAPPSVTDTNVQHSLPLNPELLWNIQKFAFNTSFITYLHIYAIIKTVVCKMALICAAISHSHGNCKEFSFLYRTGGALWWEQICVWEEILHF